VLERAFVWAARTCAFFALAVPWVLGTALIIAALLANANGRAGERLLELLPLTFATLTTASLATVVGAPVGIAVAALAAESGSPRTRMLLSGLLEVASSIPAIAVGIAFLGLLGASSNAHHIPAFIAISGALAILVAPVAGRRALRAFQALTPTLLSATAATGARFPATFISVILPAARRGVLAAFLGGFAVAAAQATAAQVIGANVFGGRGFGSETLATFVLKNAATTDVLTLAPACLALLVLGLLPVIVLEGEARSER
jgi:phosphate transport system permease protein